MRSSLASTLLSSFSLFASCNTICDRKQYERDSSRAKSLHLSKYVSQTVAKKLRLRGRRLYIASHTGQKKSQIKRDSLYNRKSHRPGGDSDQEGEHKARSHFIGNDVLSLHLNKF